MRKLILQAALDLYLQEGLEHTTMRKIAEKIDYSPTTIYLHYQSKNAILYEMQKMAFAMLLKFLYSNQVQENPYLKLKNLGKAYIEFGVMYPKHYELMFMWRIRRGRSVNSVAKWFIPTFGGKFVKGFS